MLSSTLTKTPARRGAIVAARVAVAATLALIVAACGGSSTTTPSGAKDGPAPEVEISKKVAVTGSELQPLEPAVDDSAVGAALPTLTGVGPDGKPVSISGKDGAQVIAVVAHWCSHCQKEVPMLSEMRSGGDWPDNVKLSFVSTAQMKERGNWPPSAWFSKEGIKDPILVDTEEATAGQALGTTSYPYLIGVNSDGTIAWRTIGESNRNVLLERLAELSGS